MSTYNYTTLNYSMHYLDLINNIIGDTDKVFFKKLIFIS